MDYYKSYVQMMHDSSLKYKTDFLNILIQFIEYYPNWWNEQNCSNAKNELGLHVSDTSVSCDILRSITFLSLFYKFSRFFSLY